MGWRIPFILSAVLVLVGLWVRLSIEESPVFAEAKAEIAEKQTTASHMPLLEVIKNYPREVFIARACGWRRTSPTTSSRSW